MLPPYNPLIRRPDETQAARRPVLRYQWNEGDLT